MIISEDAANNTPSDEKNEKQILKIQEQDKEHFYFYSTLY